MNALIKVFVIAAALLVLVCLCWVLSTGTYGPDNRELPRDLANFFTGERIVVLLAILVIVAGLGAIVWSQLRNFAEPDYYMALKHHHRHHRRHHHHHHHDSSNSAHGDSTQPQ